MRRALVKAAFVGSVLAVWALLMIPWLVAKEIIFKENRGPDRLYSGNDRMLVGAVPAFLCGLLANKMMSSLFFAAGWSDERLSIFRKGRKAS